MHVKGLQYNTQSCDFLEPRLTKRKYGTTRLIEPRASATFRLSLASKDRFPFVMMRKSTFAAKLRRLSTGAGTDMHAKKS